MNEPIVITIERGRHKLRAIVQWTESLGCFVGCFEQLPEVRRTGHAPGAVLDELCQVEHDALEAAFRLVFQS